MSRSALLALILISLTLLSCGLRESIVPLAAPEPLAGTELELVLPISSIDVPNITDQVNSVSLIGPIFGNIAASLADMTLHEDDGKEVPIDPVVFEFPVLEGADLSALRELKVKAIKLHAMANNEEISLHFFRKIEVYLQVKPEVLGHENITDEEANAFVDDQVEGSEKSVKGQLILSYDRDLHTLRCLTRCMDLQVSGISWKSILETGRRFVLRTRVVVDSIPASDMKIGGRVVVRGKIDPGF